MIELGKRAKKIKKKAKAKIKDKMRPVEYGTQYGPHATPAAGVDRGERGQVTDYPESAQAVQRMPPDERKRRSPVKKKTIKAMNREINRRMASVGEEGLAMLDAEVADEDKFVTLTRQTGNIGDTLAGTDSTPELVRNELIRVMALAGLWAQSLAGKRGRR